MTLESKAQEESPIRLFESDFLEFFTHISPIVVLVIFIPVIGLFFWFGFTSNPGSGWWKVILAWLIGIVIWIPAEYTLHRFVFHFHPKNPSERMKRMLFPAHGVHHAQPREKTRLVMPPMLSIPLASLFYLVFWLLVGKVFGSPNLVNGIFAETSLVILYMTWCITACITFLLNQKYFGSYASITWHTTLKHPTNVLGLLCCCGIASFELNLMLDTRTCVGSIIWKVIFGYRCKLNLENQQFGIKKSFRLPVYETHF